MIKSQFLKSEYGIHYQKAITSITDKGNSGKTLRISDNKYNSSLVPVTPVLSLLLLRIFSAPVVDCNSNSCFIICITGKSSYSFPRSQIAIFVCYSTLSTVFQFNSRISDIYFNQNQWETIRTILITDAILLK